MTGEQTVVATFVEEARRDAHTIGLLLQGSQAVGGADSDSDYDLIWVLTDRAAAKRTALGKPSHVRGARHGATLDLVMTSAAELWAILHQPDWRTAGLARSRLLLDKTGELVKLHTALREMPARTAREQVEAQCGAYLNGFYRSLKAWQRGDELAARLHASESLTYLARLLFALERRWPPYLDWLRPSLDELRAQGWRDEELADAFLHIVSTGDPTLQQQLEARVEALLRSRGFGRFVDAWLGEIDRVKAFEFAAPRSYGGYG